MRNSTRVLLPLGIAILVGACAEDDGGPTGPNADLAVSILHQIERHRVTGSCSTRFELFDFVFRPPPHQDVPVRAKYRNRGTCRLSHLGVTKLSNHGRLDFTVQPARGTGTFTLTAANGDRLRGVEEGDFPPPDDNGHFTFAGTRTITGGSGRFEDAHGRLSFRGTGSNETSTTQQLMKGHIAF